MLWREAYRTKWAKDLRAIPFEGRWLDGTTVEPVDFRVLAAGFDLAAFGEVRLWKNLIQTLSFPTDQFAFGFFTKGEDDRQELIGAVPNSEQSSWAILEDREAWLKLVEPDRPSRAFAVILVGNEIPLIMSGPPTEDAWEIFESEALALRAQLSGQ